MPSFLAVTGGKEDLWLVETVGVLVVAIGAALLFTRADLLSSGTALLAINSAAGLAAIDVIYVVKKVISPIYLADAVTETIFVIGWIINWIRHRSK